MNSSDTNMDIFGDDIDSFYNNNELNENINGEHIEEADEENAANKDDDEGEGEGKTDENGEPIKVEPKKRSVRRPRVRVRKFHDVFFYLLLITFFFVFIVVASEC